MLNQNTINAVYPLADKLQRKGIQVDAISSTPLSALVDASHYPMPTVGVNERPEFVELLMEGSMAKGADGVVQHDIVMDEVVEVVAGTVARNLDMAKNRVNPMVRMVADNADALLSAAAEIKPTLISVDPDFYHAVWSDPILLEMIERYRETPVRAVDLYMSLPGPTDRDGLFELIRTGASRFDERLLEWYNTLPEEKIVGVFTSIFQPSGGQSRVLGDHINPYVQCRNEILLTHLFSRRLYQEPPEGSGVSLDEYRSHLSAILSQSGRAVITVMRNRETDVKMRRLVRRYPIGDKDLGSVPVSVVVNGDLYNQWLTDGGSPEVLFGAYLDDQKIHYQQLLDNAEGYAGAWGKKERILQTTNRFNRFNQAVEAITSAVATAINEMEDDELPVSRPILHARLREETAKLHGQFYNDWYHTARKLVCRVVFPHTDALQILCAIDEACVANPDIDVREAALLATIDYVSVWVSKLCKLEYGTAQH